MKANELMIDDWVYNKNIDKPMQVYPMMLSQMFRRTPDATTEDYNIFPIPLTAEILEKNGFIKDTDEDDRVVDKYHLLVPTGYERNSYTIQVSLYKEPICGVSTLVKCWGQTPPYNGGMNDIHLCSANYVHQLQHAMRLCGIDKEIEL